MQEDLEKLGILATAILAIVGVLGTCRRLLTASWALLIAHVNMPTQVDRLVSLVADRIAVSEVRHEMLLDSLDLASWESDLTGAVTLASESLAKLMGCEIDDITGWSWESLIHYEDRANVKELWTSAVANRSRFASHHRFVRQNDGAVVRVYARAAPAFNDQGKLVAFIGHVAREDDPS